MTTTTEIERRPEEEPEHEHALADLDLPDESAREVTGGTRDVTAGTPGGCDEFGCGMNHNEVLVVTAQGRRRATIERGRRSHDHDHRAGAAT